MEDQTYIKEVQRDFEKKVIESLRRVDGDTWKIKFDGEYVKVSSGKSSWEQIEHAKSAFRNHVSSVLALMRYQVSFGRSHDVRGSIPYQEYSSWASQFISKMVSDGRLEFVRVGD